MPKASPQPPLPQKASASPAGTAVPPPFWKSLFVRFTAGRGGQIMASLGFALLLWHLLEFPHHTFDATHDLSSHATFEYYAAHDFQFGTEVYQNVGPYGYVHYAYSYIGYLHGQKVVLKSICRLLLVLLIFSLGGTWKSPLRKFLWWASFFVFIPLGDAGAHDFLDLDENYAYLTVYLAGLWLLQDRKDRAFASVSAALWFFLGFFSLTKHTCFVLTVTVAGVVVLQNLWRRHFTISLVGAVLFPISLAAHWLLAGQRIGNLPAFVQGIFSFSGGYNEAMAVDAPSYAVGLGLAVLALLLARVIFNARRGQGIGRTALEAFLWFILWKHSFVRADVIHVLIFFYAALLFALPTFFYRIDRAAPSDSAAPSSHRRWLAVAGCATVILLSFISFYVVFPDTHYRPMRLVHHLRHNLSWLRSPAVQTRKMEAQLTVAKNVQSLPQTQAAVGRATIDFFGYSPGYILLNDLNYRSRPMPITFAAVNPQLQQANERFYRDPQTAPEFVLCGEGGIDDRLYLQDDALAFRALLDNYRPVLLEQGMLLLQRRGESAAAAPRQETLLEERVVQFGETVSCEKWQGQPLWLEVGIKPTIMGQARSFLYKPPPCDLGLQVAGENEMVFRKFVTAMGECGFILHPLLGGNADLLAFHEPRHELPKFGRAARIVFTCADEDRKLFQETIRLRFFTFARPKP